jgi:CDP-diacylglycerol--glycerol-3-phosphate 3-phosphatidyltransferase
MLFFIKQPILFFSIYLLCGFSDVLDGIIARAMNTKSVLGAKLDSVADFILFGVIIVGMIIFFGSDLAEFYPLVAVVMVIRIGGLLFAGYKYHTFLMLHTWGNKITGIFVFLTPLFLLLQNSLIIYLVLALAILSAIEEFILHIITEQPNPDRKGLLFK